MSYAIAISAAVGHIFVGVAIEFLEEFLEGTQHRFHFPKLTLFLALDFLDGVCDQLPEAGDNSIAATFAEATLLIESAAYAFHDRN